MTKGTSGTLIDLRLGQRLLVVAALFASCSSLAAQPAPYRHEVFDAHMHWNQEPNPFYALDKVLEIFRRNGVTGVLATSRPNKGTQQLVEAKPQGLWIVPFIRPYRVRADIQTWFKDPAIFELIKDEFKRGYYRGVGEFHIYGNDAAEPLVKSIVDFAVERDRMKALPSWNSVNEMFYGLVGSLKGQRFVTLS